MTRTVTILATSIASAALGTSAAIDLPKPLLWNASASAPIGLYAAQPADELQVSDLVVIAPPPELATFLAARGYLPKGVPLLKRFLRSRGKPSAAMVSTFSPTARRSDAPASATAPVANCRSGKAAAASPTANSSS